MKEKVDQEELLRIFPGKLRKRIEEKVSFEEVTEIRLRTGLPISIEMCIRDRNWWQDICNRKRKNEKRSRTDCRLSDHTTVKKAAGVACI